MFCSGCSSRMEANRNFCQNCGKFSGKSNTNNPGLNKNIIIIAGVVLVAMIALFMVQGGGVGVSRQLQGTWSSSSMIFEFRGNTITERRAGNDTWLNSGTFSVIGEDRMEVVWLDGSISVINFMLTPNTLEFWGTQFTRQ